MAKEKTVYVCSNCGQESPKWVGKCPSCGEWNTYVEEVIRKEVVNKRPVSGIETEKPKPIVLSEIEADDEPRIDLHDEELNRVLGGGLVPGSLVLIGGEPGIGKSTLVLQTVLHIPEKRVLYVSGEESARQLKLRADRLSHNSTDCLIVCETSLEQIFVHIKNTRPELVIIDSIQTISTESIESSPGSIAQVRECSASILRFAKETHTPVLLIGHINKEGSIAGPKVLEHIVDTVLQFEGDQHYMYRILRSIKNRFGSTLRQDIKRNILYPCGVNIERKDGSAATVSLKEWTEMELYEKDALKSWGFSYAPNQVTEWQYHYSTMFRQWMDQAFRYMPQDLEERLNMQYMEAAQNPDMDKYRIPQGTAKQMLLYDEAPVYRLLPSGSEKIAPIAAVSTGLWYENYREFAIAPEDLGALDKLIRRETDRLTGNLPQLHKNEERRPAPER